MGVVPKLESSCFCCSLKTGSFVTAWLLLVGSSVQIGYYAFLVDHMYPQKMCKDYEPVFVRLDPPALPDYDYYGTWREDLLRLKHLRQSDWWSQGQSAANNTDRRQANESNAANSAGGEPGNSSRAPRQAGNTAGSERAHSSFTSNTAAVGERANSQHKANITAGQQKNSSYTANTTSRTPTNSSNAARNNSTVNGKRHHKKNRHPLWPFRIISSYPQYKVEYREYEKPCGRDYKPFDADFGLLDFDLRGPFDKTILYINIGIWVILMVATIPLMAAVYKEWASLLCAWLAWEAVFLGVATAAAMATAVAMFRAVPVQIGIVTLLNMAIHLGIDIYLMMVVVNYRRSLTTKEENVEDDEQVIV